VSKFKENFKNLKNFSLFLVWWCDS